MATAEEHDLFQARGAAEQASSAPLAARMRPRTLDEFVGQDHIVGPGRLLRRAIQADQLSSLIFYGPPGTGKTTLAQVIAGTTRARFTALNAVLAGVKQLREAIAAARDARDLHGKRTILFIDEVHRWNKAQQDALLPSVENGTIILIGATTENPYFEVIKPLVSRSRIFQLQGLERGDLARVAQMALADTERGLGRFRAEVSEEAMEHLLNVANGDARSLLNALELAVSTTPGGDDGVVRVDRQVAEESIQRRAVLYDKEGDAHYDTISAFIKSVRGSDPDASLYWMARMVYAGEDPRYLFRRMLILAAEDVGMADPAAIQVVTACAAAFDYVGLPEGRFHLAEAALYLATAPKSNSTFGFFDALRAVEAEREAEVPSPLRDASRDAEGFGHGAGYQYPHAFTDHWVAQQYLPEEMQGRVFYQPGDTGHERAIRDEVARRREANLAAAWEGTENGAGEILTNAGETAQRELDRWLERALSDAAGRLGGERDRIVAAAGLPRHGVVLDLGLGSGLLTFELLRRCPEGGVWAIAPPEAKGVREQLATLPATMQPTLVAAPAQIDPAVRFDAVLGRNVWRTPGGEALVRDAAARLAERGRLVLAESLPERAPRLHEVLDLAGLDDADRAAVAAAEEAHYGVRPALTGTEIEAALTPHVTELTAEIVEQPGRLAVTRTLLERWFPAASPAPASSYAHVLQRAGVSVAAVAALRRGLENRLGTTLDWRVATLFVTATRPPAAS
jgi:putative ATPase